MLRMDADNFVAGSFGEFEGEIGQGCGCLSGFAHGFGPGRAAEGTLVDMKAPRVERSRFKST